MRKIAALICGIAVVAAMSGCSTVHESQWSAPLLVQLTTPVTPVVEAGDEITGTAVITRILFFKTGCDKFADGVTYAGNEGANAGLNIFGNTMAEGKAAAAYAACKANGADVIIAPRYTIESKNYIVYEKITFNVKGYKGIFKGLKK